jgi:hypothetical protein
LIWPISNSLHNAVKHNKLITSNISCYMFRSSSTIYRVLNFFNSSRR